MYHKKLPVILNCGLHLFKEVLSGKWKTMLIYNLHSGIKRPGELQRMIPDADRRVLNTQINELIDHGLVSKVIFPTLPQKVEYELTSLGKSLLPVIQYMDQWGEDNRRELEQHITIK